MSKIEMDLSACDGIVLAWLKNYRDGCLELIVDEAKIEPLKSHNQTNIKDWGETIFLCEALIAHLEV